MRRITAKEDSSLDCIGLANLDGEAFAQAAAFKLRSLAEGTRIGGQGETLEQAFREAAPNSGVPALPKGWDTGGTMIPSQLALCRLSRRIVTIGRGGGARKSWFTEGRSFTRDRRNSTLLEFPLPSTQDGKERETTLRWQTGGRRASTALLEREARD